MEIHPDPHDSRDSQDQIDTSFPIAIIPEAELDALQYQLDHFDDFFTWGEKLGEGSYASVYRIIANKSGRSYAIKLFKRDTITPKVQRMIDAESSIIRGFQIPHVISYYARSIVAMGPKSYVGILMDYLPGSNLDAIRADKKGDLFSEYAILRLMRQTLIGIGSLHELNIAHRDVKAENIIYDDRQHDLTIIDLGLACCSPCDRNGPFQCNARKGTPLFMPPELFELSEDQLTNIPIDFLKACDVWAFGVTFFYLIYNVFPYDADDIKQFRHKIINHEMNQVPPKPEMSRAIDVVENAMLPLDQRPSAEELLDLVDEYLDELEDDDEPEGYDDEIYEIEGPPEGYEPEPDRYQPLTRQSA
jgi:serine/threonine protein kinase